jgi:hypothetical protein
MNRRRFLLYVLLSTLPVKLVSTEQEFKVIKDAQGRWYL